MRVDLFNGDKLIGTIERKEEPRKKTTEERLEKIERDIEDIHKKLLNILNQMSHE